jgi:hypothetical protein
LEFAKRVPENLHAKMLEVNEQKKLVNRLPPLSAVKDWVEQAKAEESRGILATLFQLFFSTKDSI